MAQSSVSMWPRAVSIALCAALAIGVGIVAVKSRSGGENVQQAIAVGEPSPDGQSTEQTATQPAARPLADVDGERIANADSEPGNWQIGRASCRERECQTV